MLTANDRLTVYMRQRRIIGPKGLVRFETDNPWARRMTPKQRRRVLKKAFSRTA